MPPSASPMRLARTLAACMRSAIRSDGSSAASAAAESRLAQAVEAPGALRELFELGAPRVVFRARGPRRARSARARSGDRRASREIRDLEVAANALLRGAHVLELDQEHPREIGVTVRGGVVIAQPRRGALTHRAARGSRGNLGLSRPLRARCPRFAAAATVAATRRPAARPPARARAGPTPPTRRSPPGRRGRARVRWSRAPPLPRRARRARGPPRVFACAAPPRAAAREARAEERHELAMLALALVESLERAGQLRVAGLELLELLEVPDRPIRSVGEVFRGLRGVFQQRRALLAGGRLEGPIVEGEQIVPPLARVEHELEAIEGPVRGGVELENALEDAHHPRGVVEPLLVELHGAFADGDRQLLREGAESTSS